MRKSARSLQTKPRCVDCGSSDIDESTTEPPFCSDCLRLRAIHLRRTPEVFVELAESLAHLGSRIPGKGLESVLRRQEALSEVAETWMKTTGEMATRLEQRRDAVRNKIPNGDEYLAHDLCELLDDGDYGLDHWLPDLDLSPLLTLCAENPEVSLAELFVKGENSTRVKGLIEDAFLGPLLGLTLTSADLLNEPWYTRLQGVGLMPFSLGFARIVEIAGSLRNGFPPEDSFGPEERELYLRLEPVSLRRTAQAWHTLSSIYYGLKARIDRTEQMIPVWLLFPTRPPLSGYLKLLYDSYVAGHDAASISFCRTMLERAVIEAEARVGQGADNKMIARIGRLADLGRLSPAGARRARDVWVRGNVVVHKDPVEIADSFVVITDTLEVLRELVPVEGWTIGGHDVSEDDM